MYLNPEQAPVAVSAPRVETVVAGRRRRPFDLLGALRPDTSRDGPGPVGLELSQEYLNLVQFDHVAGQPVLRAVVAVPLPVEREALVADPAAFRRLLREAWRGAAFRGRDVVTCMPATLVRLSVVTYRCKGEDSDAAAIAELARERLGAEADACVVDYVPVRTRGENEGERAALLAAARREHVIEYLETLRRAGLAVQALEVGPAAIARAVTHAHRGREDDNVLTVNVGRERCYLTVFSGRRLILDREVAFGEGALVATVAVGLDTGGDEARRLLSRYGLAAAVRPVALQAPIDDGEDGIAATLSEILRGRLLELRDEIGKAALYAASHTRGAGIREVLLLGGVTRWPNIATALGGVLDLPVAVTDPLSSLPSRAGVRLPLDAGVLSGLTGATGCALRGSPRRA